MLGSPAGYAGGATQRGLWPLAPAPAPPAAHLSNEGYSRYGVYSLFPGAGSPAPGIGVGAALYSHTSTIGRFGSGQAATPGHTSATTFHTAHKVTDSLFSSSNYTFGAPTPPPGSPYSPIPVAQLELLTKGISSSVASVVHSSNNTVFSVKKPLSLNTTDDKRCEERCWAAVKSEKRLSSSSSSCGCLGSPTKTKFSDSNSGCSRTNPVDWSSVCVKREPGAVPCQVAEVTTSDVGASVVKVEATSPTIATKTDPQVTVPQAVANGNIPIGIAVARQRLQHDLTPNSPTLGHQGLLAPITPLQSFKDLNRIAEIASPGMAATATGGVTGGGAMLQCGDDRATGLATWPMGGAHGPALSAPTLWQYPAPMLEPMLPMPLPMPPVGFQLVRDPASGHFLLIPTATLEQLQQAVVWPSYPQPSSHVLLPPLPPPPLAPLQLLSSSSADYLATSTTLHQHTQSTRLVALTTDTKRKLPMPLPAHTLIKIEADCTSATSTLDQTKQVHHSVSTVSSNTGAIYTDPSVTPLLTTHLFYQHPTTNLILSHTADPSCKSQATSPACLTPPPEGSPLHDQDMPLSLCVQDASNQTDTHIFSEDEHMIETTNDDSINNNYCKTPARSETPDKIDVIDSTVEIKYDQITEVPESTIVNNNNNNKYEYIENKNDDCVIQPILEEPEEKICKPDLSGLELLSNSIVEFENSRQSAETTPIKYEIPHELKVEEQIQENNDDVLTGIAHMTLKDRESEATPSAVDDTLGGLGLLCALAEQRFMEEVVDKQQAEAKKHKKERRCDSEERRNKKKLKRCHDVNDSKTKRFKHSTGGGEFDYERRPEEDLINEHELAKIRENELELERERLSVLKRVTGERGLTAAEKGKRDLSSDLGITAECDKRKTDKYRKDNDLNGSKNNNCSCKDERNNHRTYKNRECEDDRTFTNNNNNCNNNNNNNTPQQQQQLQSNSELAPGIMSAVERDMRQQLADLQRQYKEKQIELNKLAPKKLECDLQNEQIKTPLIERSPSPPLLDKIDTTLVIRHASPSMLKPPTLCPITPPPLEESKSTNDSTVVKQETHKRKSSICDSSDSTPEKISSSKKRKVGRPKKVLTSAGLCVATETIVAKKPRSKTSLVGYLLAAKKHLQMQNKSELIYAASSPPKYSEETPTSTPTKVNKLKAHQNGRISNNSSENEQKASKIRPKLKAETQLKQYTEDEDTAASEWEIASQTEEDAEVSDITPEPEEPVPTAQTEADVRCILTADHLDVDKLRVLTAMGGLFYAGQLTAIQAPDVYAITLDGERGNRPHIMSREEILRDAIVEVSPTSTSELIPGTRLCAYWSQQYRCLYPGTVAEAGTPDPELDLKFVSVEFDDGDSGRIALDDIRLLPTDYPIIEYDPNPLLSLSKRRRRTSVNSVTEERRLTNQTNNPTLVTVPTPQIPIEPTKSVTPLAEKENTALNRQDSHRERKRLKKRRKEKLKRMMCHDDKKKKRKHRCCDEHCKHRKHHKKHRKHKKHHHSRVEVEEQQVPAEPLVVEEVAKNEIIEDEEEEENIVPTKVENKVKKSKKRKERRESNESRSKMAAFLPARQIWGWSGRGYKRVGVKGRARKQFFKSIQRGRESITVGDCAVFLSTGRPDRPYIGKIEAMWESWGTNMVVRVKWFYHPEETVGCPPNLKYPGALFESPHIDENDVQTISHKCEVLPLKDYTAKLGPEPQRYETIYDNNDIYYLAGYYDPITPSLTMEPDIPVSESDE